MTSAAPTAPTTQVYRVWIKATPEAIWDAITSPEWTQKYGYGGIPEYDLRPGSRYRVRPSEPMASVPGVPDVIIDGEILEVDPSLAAMVAGEHEAEGAGGGWAWVLSDLKTLLETGDTIVTH
jgi:hypothetical protein